MGSKEKEIEPKEFPQILNLLRKVPERGDIVFIKRRVSSSRRISPTGK